MGLGRSLRRQSFKDSDSSSSCSHMGSGLRLECSPFVNADGEEGEVWSYFETSPPYSRVPLVDKVGPANIHVLSCWKSNEQWQQFETLCSQESMQMNLWNSCYLILTLHSWIGWVYWGCNSFFFLGNLSMLSVRLN
jgi:hypothetical protein